MPSSRNLSTATLDRRSFLVGSLAIGALTACSSAATASDSATPTSIRVTGDGYDVTVPSDPRRVVVVEGRGDLDFALMAGYPIVASGNTYAPGTVPDGQYQNMLSPDVIAVGGPDGPNAEEIVALAPDLIIMRANGFRKDFYGNEQLGKIAPILPVEVNEPDFEQQTTRQFTVLNRMPNVQNRIDDYRRVIEHAKTELGAALSESTIAMLTSEPVGKGYVNLWTDQLGTSVAADLGLTVVEHDPGDTDGELQISVENLGLLAGADFIVHQTTDPSMIADVSTWRALPAIAAGRSAVLDPRLNNGLMITATAIAERLVEVVRQGS